MIKGPFREPSEAAQITVKCALRRALLIILWSGAPGAAVAPLDMGWNQKQFIIIHYR